MGAHNFLVAISLVHMHYVHVLGVRVYGCTQIDAVYTVCICYCLILPHAAREKKERMSDPAIDARVTGAAANDIYVYGTLYPQ